MANVDFKNKINEIKFKLMTGQLSYYQAKELAQPIIDEMNERGKIIAKKYNQRFKPFTFASLMR
ncbi:MAG: hypothetical protein IKW45_03820 [Clostridia bacterium]|nr:hypothetical protein [Clostridia bacterium]